MMRKNLDEKPENILVFPYSIAIQLNFKLESIVPDKPRYGIKIFVLIIKKLAFFYFWQLMSIDLIR